MKFTYVFDLDGTICESTRGGEEYFSAKPVEAMIARIKDLKSQGHTIVIQTARGMNLYGGDLKRIEYNMRARTERWLKDNGVPFDALYFGKVAGDVYVDDKAVSAEDFLDFPSRD